MELDGKCNRVLLLVGIRVFQWYGSFSSILHISDLSVLVGLWFFNGILRCALGYLLACAPSWGQLPLLSPVAHLVHIEAQSATGHLLLSLRIDDFSIICVVYAHLVLFHLNLLLHFVYFLEDKS